MENKFTTSPALKTTPVNSEKKSSLLTVGLIALLAISLGMNGYLFSKYTQLEKEDQTTGTYQTETEFDWQTYEDTNLGLKLKYPQDYSVESEGELLIINSPEYSCREKGSSEAFTPTSEITIDVTRHEGESFAAIWEEAFGFEFGDENTYDGTQTIAGKPAYFFHQGAEMPFGREANLIELSPTEALGVNIYTPTYSFECEDQTRDFTANEKYTKITDQIIATFEIVD